MPHGVLVSSLQRPLPKLRLQLVPKLQLGNRSGRLRRFAPKPELGNERNPFPRPARISA